ncbi:mitochondrial 54S ribosomal protein uL13m [Ascoidea rubescens DSM 1968]|uniref:Large ribosomal subunit protein uL13m n=1 Tax=Ascoidea rubescens DSM 1968 TaxID=1344418 RepID=A0A1D2VLN5_9ASCO|nr:ribosomal protein L13 [Ascoidea rubescens DSM 1968]ODV62512.1 ribosomal protein L13 [Ascoidea rubescens DSM 1968]
MSAKIGKTGLAYARVWHHINVSKADRPLGRIATDIAVTLMGKHKPIYTGGNDCGDYVVATNCVDLEVTGNKFKQKLYYRHSTRPGNLKKFTMEKVSQDKGFGEVLVKAVSRMLPKNSLRKIRLNRLKVFDGNEHPYKQNLIAFYDEQPEVRKLLKRQEKDQQNEQTEKTEKEAGRG